jgi:hypothetical protein
MMLREGSMGSCLNCGSSENKKYWFFGPRKCINPECLLSTEWRSRIEAEIYLRRTDPNFLRRTDILRRIDANN